MSLLWALPPINSSLSTHARSKSEGLLQWRNLAITYVVFYREIFVWILFITIWHLQLVQITRHTTWQLRILSVYCCSILTVTMCMCVSFSTPGNEPFVYRVGLLSEEGSKPPKILSTIYYLFCRNRQLCAYVYCPKIRNRQLVAADSGYWSQHTKTEAAS